MFIDYATKERIHDDFIDGILLLNSVSPILRRHKYDVEFSEVLTRIDLVYYASFKNYFKVLDLAKAKGISFTDEVLYSGFFKVYDPSISEDPLLKNNVVYLHFKENNPYIYYSPYDYLFWIILECKPIEYNSIEFDIFFVRETVLYYIRDLFRHVFVYNHVFNLQVDDFRYVAFNKKGVFFKNFFGRTKLDYDDPFKSIIWDEVLLPSIFDLIGWFFIVDLSNVSFNVQSTPEYLFNIRELQYYFMLFNLDDNIRDTDSKNIDFFSKYSLYLSILATLKKLLIHFYSDFNNFDWISRFRGGYFLSSTIFQFNTGKILFLNPYIINDLFNFFNFVGVKIPEKNFKLSYFIKNTEKKLLKVDITENQMLNLFFYKLLTNKLLSDTIKKIFFSKFYLMKKNYRSTRLRLLSFYIFFSLFIFIFIIYVFMYLLFKFFF